MEFIHAFERYCMYFDMRTCNHSVILAAVVCLLSKKVGSNYPLFQRYYRSSRLDVFCKKCVLRNFAKFTGKHLCQSVFFNKVAGLRPASLLKKKLWHRCFPVNFTKSVSLRTPFLTQRFWWLLLIL